MSDKLSVCCLNGVRSAELNAGFAASPLSSAVRLCLTGAICFSGYVAIPRSNERGIASKERVVLPVRRSLTALESGRAALPGHRAQA